MIILVMDSAEDDRMTLNLTICVSHLLLTLSHQRKLLHDGIGQVFEFLQFELEWLELGGFSDLIGKLRGFISI